MEALKSLCASLESKNNELLSSYQVLSEHVKQQESDHRRALHSKQESVDEMKLLLNDNIAQCGALKEQLLKAKEAHEAEMEELVEEVHNKTNEIDRLKAAWVTEVDPRLQLVSTCCKIIRISQSASFSYT